jgi:hypothetical protein
MSNKYFLNQDKCPKVRFRNLSSGNVPETGRKMNHSAAGKMFLARFFGAGFICLPVYPAAPCPAGVRRPGGLIRA